MRISNRFTSALLATLFAVALHAETVRYDARPGSKVKIDGTSTVHDWTVESGIIAGYIQFEASEPLDFNKTMSDLKVTPKVEVSIPVSSIKSGKPLMDEVMHDAMKIKDFKKIEYTLKEMKPREHKAGEPLQFDTKGDLTVSGVKKEIDMVVTMEPVEGSKIKTTGTKQLKMTDFGIKPPAPSLGLGLIKTADEVTISFEWITAKRTEKKTASIR